MTRVKRGVTSRRRHKRLLNLTEGQWGSRHKLVKRAREAMLKSLSYSYRDRRARKRDMRRLWILRINAAARQSDFTYAKLIAGLKKAGVEVDRKMMAELAVNDSVAFNKLVEVAKKA